MTWEDAVHDTDFDGKPEEAGKTELCVEIGFLVRKTRKIIVLASEKSVDGGSVRWTMTIPASLVRKIEPLEVKPPDGS